MGARTTTSSKKPTRPYKPKVKTGCMSCRTRRVKCDEAKPSCKRCTQTGRSCDGYEDLFRPLQWTPAANTRSTKSNAQRDRSPATTATKTKSQSPKFSVIQIQTPPLTPPSHASTPTRAPSYILHQSPTPEPPSTVTPLPLPRPRAAVSKEEVAALAQRFSNKHVAGGYEAEARATLEASRSEPAVRHAIGALTSLYETLENHGHALLPSDGLQEYNNAISKLTSKLSSVDARAVEVVLICNRLFISIEVMLRSYMAATKHYFRGLKIMHEAGARAHIDASNNVVPAQNPHLPKIDKFMLKIFTARDPLSPHVREATRAIKKGKKMSPKEFTQIARFARTEVRAYRAKGRLLAVAERVVQFLDKVTKLQPGADVEKVLEEKRGLVGLLEHMWDDFQAPGDGRSEFGPYHKRFLSIFHTAVWIPLYMSLWPPTRDISEMLPLFDRISGIAWNASRAREFGKLMDVHDDHPA